MPPFDLIPLRGKRPIGKDWPIADYSGFDFAAWDGNTGLRLRPCDLVIDADPRHFKPGDDPLLRLSEAVGFDLESAPATLTGGGGLHLFFTKPEGLQIAKYLPDYPGLEFYSAVHFLVAPGSIHPDSGRSYEARGDLGSIAPAPGKLLELVARKKVERTAEPGVLDEGELAALLAALDPTRYGQGRYSEWIALGAACHDATGGHGSAEWLAWCARDPAYDNTEAQEAATAMWDSFEAGRPGGATYRSLFRALREAGQGALLTAIELRIAVADFAGVEDEDELDGYMHKGFVSIGRVDRTQIPHMRFVIPGFLQCGEVTLLAGQGGVGKSLHAWAIGVAVALGVGFGWWPAPERPRRVLCLSGEDDQDEIARRVAVACQSLGHEMDELRDNLIIWGRQDIRLVVKNLETGGVGTRPLWQAVKDAVRQLDIGLLIIDPLIRVGQGFSENDNIDMDILFRRLQGLVAGRDCALLVDDHFAKSGGADDQNAIRGASAKVNAARCAITLTRMTKAEHERLRPPRSRQHYILFAMPKVNYSGRPEGERWLEMKEFEVGNGEQRPALIWRDLVAAREFFDPFAWEHKDELLSMVEAGYEGKPWRCNMRKQRELQLNCAMAAYFEMSEKGAQGVLKEFEQVGMLKREQIKTENRKLVEVWQCTGVRERPEDEEN